MTCILGVPLYAKFCLSRWEFGRIGWTRWWNIQIKFNTTEVRDHQVHPVDHITLGEVKLSSHKICKLSSPLKSPESILEMLLCPKRTSCNCPSPANADDADSSSLCKPPISLCCRSSSRSWRQWRRSGRRRSLLLFNSLMK